MIKMKANLDVIDSQSNTTIERTALQAALILPLYNVKTQQYTEKRK